MVTKEQILSVLESTKLPCVHITPESDRTPGPTDSKFGGDYYLPAGGEVSELEFLAQINFAQVPRLKGFPERGLLQFFLCTGSDEFEGFIENESVFQRRRSSSLSMRTASRGNRTQASFRCAGIRRFRRTVLSIRMRFPRHAGPWTRSPAA